MPKNKQQDNKQDNITVPQFDKLVHVKYDITPDKYELLMNAIYKSGSRSYFDFYDGESEAIRYSRLDLATRKVLIRLGYDIVTVPHDSPRLLDTIENIKVHIHKDKKLSAVIVGIRSSSKLNEEGVAKYLEDIDKIQAYFLRNVGIVGDVQVKRRVGKC